MSILIYLRLWNKVFFDSISNIVFYNSKMIYYSDFKNVGDVWTGNYIYDNKYDNEINKEILDDVIIRCRFLRSLKKDKAVQLCTRLYNGINELFDKNDFDAVIMPIIDCYSLDIISRVAKAHNVPVVSFVQNFIDGYSRFSLRGELVPLNREVSQDEIDNVYSMLCDKEYKVSFSLNKQISLLGLLKRYFRDFAKERIYYTYKKITTKDLYNYHYNTYGNTKISEIVSLFTNDYFKHISDVQIDMEHCVYLPLHFTPEATVDYWSDNVRDCNYESRIISIINHSDKGIHFLVKEHPAMMGRRKSSFYKKLNCLENVDLIHPYDNSNQLLSLVDTVVVHTGSVGVEALLRNKRVLCFTHNYYSDLHPNAIRIKKVSNENLAKPIVSYDPKMFLRDLLDGLFKYRYVAGWEVKQKSDDINILAKWCELYYRNSKGE